MLDCCRVNRARCCAVDGAAGMLWCAVVFLMLLLPGVPCLMMTYFVVCPPCGVQRSMPWCVLRDAASNYNARSEAGVTCRASSSNMRCVSVLETSQAQVHKQHVCDRSANNGHDQQQSLPASKRPPVGPASPQQRHSPQAYSTTVRLFGTYARITWHDLRARLCQCCLNRLGTLKLSRVPLPQAAATLL